MGSEKRMFPIPHSLRTRYWAAYSRSRWHHVWERTGHSCWGRTSATKQSPRVERQSIRYSVHSLLKQNSGAFCIAHTHVKPSLRSYPPRVWMAQPRLSEPTFLWTLDPECIEFEEPAPTATNSKGKEEHMREAWAPPSWTQRFSQTYRFSTERRGNLLSSSRTSDDHKNQSLSHSKRVPSTGRRGERRHTHLSLRLFGEDHPRRILRIRVGAKQFQKSQHCKIRHG